MNRISTIAVKEVTVKGYEVVETKMVSLDNEIIELLYSLSIHRSCIQKNIDQLKEGAKS